MKSKKVFLLTIVAIIIGFILFYNNRIGNKIPEGYIAIFHGGFGELTHETYIYKKNNGHDNFGFKYINTSTSTESWGSSQLITRITKRGSVQWTDDVFKAAKENNAYEYVTLPNDNKSYTIQEFMSMFSMD